MGTDSTSTQRIVPTCHVAALRTGGVSVAQHIAAIIDLTPTGAADDGPPTDLVLGYPALSQANWMFDFPARRWSASSASQGSACPPSWSSTPLTTQNRLRGEIRPGGGRETCPPAHRG